MNTSFFTAEYPMIRWLEGTGTTSAISPASTRTATGALIKQHKIFMSVGHDEYWSADNGQRRSCPRQPE